MVGRQLAFFGIIFAGSREKPFEVEVIEEVKRNNPVTAELRLLPRRLVVKLLANVASDPMKGSKDIGEIGFITHPHRYPHP